MGKCSFIFPGQGSQSVGMSPTILSSSISKLYFDKASEALGYDLMDICLSGPDSVLRKTINAQPSIFTISIIVDTLLKESNIFPASVAGHSLGEYSAIVSCGSLKFSEAIELIVLRAREMEKANDINHGSMAAVINASDSELNQILESAEGVLVVANFNSQNQIVISGEKKSIVQAIEFSENLSRRIKCIELNVSGAFHSPLMNFAREALSNEINSLNFRDAEIPIYQNINSRPTMSALEIKENLKLQLENPVRWHQTISSMVSDQGIDMFLECGPGNILTGINKRISRDINSTPVNSMDSIESLCTKS